MRKITLALAGPQGGKAAAVSSERGQDSVEGVENAPDRSAPASPDPCGTAQSVHCPPSARKARTADQTTPAPPPRTPPGAEPAAPRSPPARCDGLGSTGAILMFHEVHPELHPSDDANRFWPWSSSIRCRATLQMGLQAIEASGRTPKVRKWCAKRLALAFSPSSRQQKRPPTEAASFGHQLTFSSSFRRSSASSSASFNSAM